MNRATISGRVGGRTVALSVLIAATLGLAATQAMAAVTTRVEAGTLTINGDDAENKLVLRLEPGAPNTLLLDVGGDGTADFSFDRSTFTAIEVKAKGGDDEVRIDQSGGVFTDEQITIRGGGGNDMLIGAAGAETFHGEGGDDVVDGNTGQDHAFLGGGDDRFQWDPGDASDVVEGQSGDDVLDFNASNAGEAIEVSANGPRALLTRNIGSVVMDLDGVDRVALDTFGGADTIAVNNLDGTDVEIADIDLSAVGGGGDGQPDTVISRGTDGPDRYSFGLSEGRVLVHGPGAETRVAGSEATLDNVNVEALGGADAVNASGGVLGPEAINVDGGADADSVTYRGTSTDDLFQFVSNGPEASTILPASVRYDTIGVESLVALGLAGADTFTAVGNLAALTALTMDGGADEDSLRGGNGADLLIGGSGADFVDGNQGLDRALMGSGDDRFQWDPGDGNDTVEGQSGDDRLDFNGSNIGEILEVSANGSRARLTRNIANIVMDVDGVELTAFRTLGGTDSVIVNDLDGTDVEDVHANLSGIDGVGDGQADAVIARGTDGVDRITLSSPGGYPIISGLAAEVLVEGVDPASDAVNVEALDGADTITTGREVLGPESYNVNGGLGDDVTRYNGTDVADPIDVVSNGAEVSTVSPLASRLDTTAVESLVVLGLAGNDTITGTGNLAALTALTMDGGVDNDTIRGGNGADLLLGGDGDDLVDGNQGIDRALLGRGDDRFQWDPGDGNDIVEGQAGIDALDFNGSNIGEILEVSANGSRARLTRNIASIVMDLDGLESIVVRALGGADSVVVNDVKGTDVDSVDIDLSAFGGTGDGQPDTVTVNGTNKRDVVQVTRSGAQVLVSGLAAQTRVAGGEAANDTLRIQTLDGKDAVTVAPDVSDLIAAIVDLGTGQ